MEFLLIVLAIFLVTGLLAAFIASRGARKRRPDLDLDFDVEPPHTPAPPPPRPPPARRRPRSGTSGPPPPATSSTARPRRWSPKPKRSWRPAGPSLGTRRRLTLPKPRLRENGRPRKRPPTPSSMR